MKVIYSFFTVFILLFLFSHQACISQQAKTCVQAYDLVETIKKFHYAPRNIDDDFSKDVFTGLFELLDPEKLLFSLEDIAKLKKYESSIDDEIINQDCKFLNELKLVYASKYKFTDSLLISFKKKDFNFVSKDELIVYKRKKYVYQSNLASSWEKYIKLIILKSYLSSNDSVVENNVPNKNIWHKLQEEILNKEIKVLKLKISNNGGIDEFVNSLYLKAISNTFDSHTEYFTPKEKKSFRQMLAKETVSYGIQIAFNESNEIELTDILPGSPAWNSNKLNIGDVILAVKRDDGKTADFSIMSLNEIDNFFNDPALNLAVFTVKKKSGKTIFVKLIKEKIDVEENAVKSFVLDGKDKIGYIYLPDFYSLNESDNSANIGCANDVAKEIIKLKNEKIKGLIFDIRNNGGGDMREACKLAGMFINFGAEGIIHESHNEPVTIKDMDRGSIYDGPMVVMLNEFSASASEFFAAIMQDYNRALIVGSRTFGKGTAQEILPVNAYKINNPDDIKEASEAFVKVTSCKIFRVTGKTYQKDGIMPDIILPDIFDKITIREGDDKNALTNSSIDKKTYYYPLQPFPLQELRDRSISRINNDSVFKRIINNSEYYYSIRDSFLIPLDYISFKKFYRKDLRIGNNTYDAKNNLFKVSNLSFIKGLSSWTDSKKEINEKTMQDINRDVYIKEAYEILNDVRETIYNNSK